MLSRSGCLPVAMATHQAAVLSTAAKRACSTVGAWLLNQRLALAQRCWKARPSRWI
ncbi:hypothetical protein [Trichlorobacter lovleyi]|uniref:hypothetical protein n=1 Tax=Trichlorobacter lovleyi TaxID=313985 RepID=UPI00224046E7|nr:hypothetical protein [Trichlorobacter lovleyi]